MRDRGCIGTEQEFSSSKELEDINSFILADNIQAEVTLVLTGELNLLLLMVVQ